MLAIQSPTNVLNYEMAEILSPVVQNILPPYCDAIFYI